MLLRSVEYVRPESLEQAIGHLGSGDGARALAGGQSLVNVLKLRAAAVDLLVDVSRLAELRFVEMGSDGSVEIGAAITYDELDRSDDLRRVQPKLAEVAGRLVDQQVRCRGTIGGNVCFADPTSNFPPLLVVLGATFHVAGPGGARDVPADDFFSGPYRTAVGRGEVLRSITVPALEDGAGVGYDSVLIARDSWALARAAALVRADGSIEAARVALGCVAPAPVRAIAMEQRLVGGPAMPEAVAAAAESAAEGLEPPGDVHASGDYRREMARVTAKRATLEAIATAGVR